MVGLLITNYKVFGIVYALMKANPVICLEGERRTMKDLSG
jgi:hypothetical protein